MLSRSRRMPFTFSLILSVVAVTTATRADTPFFWDDFNRESLDGGDVDWRLSSGEAYLQDGSLFMTLSDSARATAAAASTLVGDFTIRTQISFAGVEAADWGWIGILAPLSADGVDTRLNWGGVQPTGIISVGKTLGGFQETNSWKEILAADEMYEKDVDLQFDAIGGDIGVRAWFVGEDKPAEPQLTMEQVVLDGGEFAINLTGDPLLGSVAAVRHYAVLPAITGDFSGSDTLDLEDINLIDEELRRESTNRVFDLNEDALVTGEDRRILIQDLMETSFGDSNLDGTVDFADFLNLSQGFNAGGGWANGDFDGSGRVEFPDFLLLSENFGQSNVAAASVPEPVSAQLLVIGLAMGITNVRHRRA